MDILLDILGVLVEIILKTFIMGPGYLVLRYVLGIKNPKIIHNETDLMIAGIIFWVLIAFFGYWLWAAFFKNY